MANRKAILMMMMTVVAAAAPKIQVQGHRGARAVLPENTIPGFEHAIKAGADVIELDLAVTKDNVLVVSHDPLVNKKICSGPDGENTIRKLTLEQVRQWDCGALKDEDFPKQQPVPGTRIPTLDEVLALAPKGTFRYNIEIKSNQKKPELQPEPEVFAQMVVDAVRKQKLEKRVIVQSFDFRVMRALAKIAPDLTRSALYGNLPKDFVDISKEAGDTQIVAPHYLLVTKGKVKKAHAAGLQVIPWTVNTPGAWNKMIKAGVDAIITDDPAALIEYLKSKGLR